MKKYNTQNYAGSMRHRLLRKCRFALAQLLAGVVIATCVNQISWSQNMSTNATSQNQAVNAAQVSSLKIATSTTAISTGYAHVDRLAWSPDGKYFAVIGVKDGRYSSSMQTHTILVYEAATEQLIQTLPVKDSGALWSDLAFSPDGRYLVGGTGILTVWDCKTWHAVRDILGPYARGRASGGVMSLVFSPDGKRIAVHYEGVLWPETLQPGWSPGGAGIAERRKTDNSITNSDAIMIFDVETTSRVALIKVEPTEKMYDMISGNIIYSPTGEYLLTNHVGKIFGPKLTIDDDPSKYFTFLKFRDPFSGKVHKEIPNIHVMEIRATAISRDGKLVATGTNTLSKKATRNLFTDKWFHLNNQDPIRLWDVSSGKKIREFGPLRGAVKALAITPDSRVLISCQTDLTAKETIWLWDMTSGSLLARVKTPQSAHNFLGCALSPNGRRIGMPVEDKIYLVDIQY